LTLMVHAKQPRPLVQLVGCEHSYFSGKARAYLLYKGIPHELVTSDADVFGNVILPKVGWAVIPVVIENGDVIQDTATIIDHFEAVYPGIRPVLPTGTRQKIASSIMELMGDEWLKLAAMHYRWSFPEQLPYLAHEWDRASNIRGHATAGPEERRDNIRRAEELMSRFKNVLPFLGVNKDTIPGVEATYLRFIELFNEHLKSHRYLLGNSPCVGDFALMGPLYAHLYRDPVPGKLMKLRAPHVAEWVERMNLTTYPGFEKPHTVDTTGTVHTTEQKQGWLADDEIPSTLIPLLEMWFREHLPMLEQTVATFRRFVASTSGQAILEKELPRSLGMSSFTIGGYEGKRACVTFDIWKLQRLLDTISSCPEEQASGFLKRFGTWGTRLSGINISDLRVTKRNGVPNFKSTLFLEKNFKHGMASL